VAIITGMKLYGVINKTNSLFGGFMQYQYTYEPPDPEPTPGFADPDIIFVHITDVELGSLTPKQFMEQKQAILVGGAFDHWEDRAAIPDFAISENPKGDGSNTAIVTLSNAPSKVKYEITFSRPVTTSGAGINGTFDVSGETSFKLIVHGQGPLTMTLAARDGSSFREAEYDITVDAAPI